jgi:superfamily I DNA and/or RNA helicase
MCVALSRQKKLLIVVGDKAMAASENARDVTGLHGLVELCDVEEKEFNRGLVG